MEERLTGNEKKSKQLDMSYGKARNILNKQIMFKLMKLAGQDKCFQCDEIIDSPDNLSVEHKTPWLDSADPVTLFFDLDNIAFSHAKCNTKAARREGLQKVIPNGTGFRGVWKLSPNAYQKDKRERKPYRATVYFKGKQYAAGFFDTPEEAAEAYDQKALEIVGPDALTNAKLGLIK